MVKINSLSLEQGGIPTPTPTPTPKRIFSVIILFSLRPILSWKWNLNIGCPFLFFNHPSIHPWNSKQNSPKWKGNFRLPYNFHTWITNYYMLIWTIVTFGSKWLFFSLLNKLKVFNCNQRVIPNLLSCDLVKLMSYLDRYYWFLKIYLSFDTKYTPMRPVLMLLVVHLIEYVCS